MSHVFTWQTPQEGVIQCADGHVHLRGITDPERAEELVRKLTDDAARVPFTTAYAHSRLEAAGCESTIVNESTGMIVWGDAPDDWLDQYAEATAPASLTPDQASQNAEEHKAPEGGENSPENTAAPSQDTGAKAPEDAAADGTSEAEKYAISDEDLRELATAAGVENADQLTREQLVAAIEGTDKSNPDQASQNAEGSQPNS